MTDRLGNVGQGDNNNPPGDDLPDVIVGMLKELEDPHADFEKLACQVDSFAHHSDRHIVDWSFPCLMRDTRWNPALFRFGGPRMTRFPQMQKFYVYLNNRLADEELARYDTMGSFPHGNLKSVGCMLGANRFIQTLRLLENLKPEANRVDPETGMHYNSEYHLKIHLLWASRPAKDDNMAKVAMQLRAVSFSEEKWMQTIVRNPLWSAAVAQLLEMPALESLAWWYYAHSISTVESPYNRFEEFDFSRWTTNTVQEFRERRFDYKWLDQLAQQSDREIIFRFIDQAANVDEFMNDRRPALQSERLRYLTEAWLGQLSRATVFKRATTKRHQDSIQAIGVLKLADGTARDEDLSQRLQVLREVRSTRKKVGAQRQDNERKHIGFALDALSHQAGLENTQELWWRSELEEIELLCGEPVGVRLDDLTVELVVQDNGMPELKVERKGKPLKAIPAAAKKDIAVADLVDRRTLLVSMRKQIAQALEEAMVNQEKFPISLILALASQPLPAALLCRCVFLEVHLNKSTGAVGFPTTDFRALEDIVSGKVKKLNDHASVKLAHPVELEAVGCLSKLQDILAERSREQPFRQLDREFTAATTEEERKQVTRKFSSKPVDARVLGGVTQARGWSMHHPSEPCEFRRKFSNAGVTASLVLDGHFFSALEPDADGLAVHALEFVDSRSEEVLRYTDVPAVAFNEAVRDVDLFIAKAL